MPSAIVASAILSAATAIVPGLGTPATATGASTGTPIVTEVSVFKPRSQAILSMATASADPVDWTVGVRHAKILKMLPAMATSSNGQPNGASSENHDLAAEARALVKRVIDSGDVTALVRLSRVCLPETDLCDRKAVLARLHAVDAGNGAPAATALQQAIKDNSGTAAIEAIDAMAAATHVQFDINRVLAAEMRMAARARELFPTTPRPGNDPDTEQRQWWLERNGTFLAPYLLELDALARVCVPGGSATLPSNTSSDAARIIKSCRHFWRLAAEDSFPPELAHLPYYVVMQIPETPEELLAARKQARRILWTQEQCTAQLNSPLPGERWSSFYNRWLSGDFLGACGALNAAAGIAKEPARDWKPKSISMRDVPQDWLRQMEAGGNVQ